MADLKKRLPENVPGDFFVDATCENFDICRQLAPETFIEAGRFAVVGNQPVTEGQRRRALQALVSCPKGSIGTELRSSVKEVFEDFPMLVEDEVYYCGFNTIKSAGANAYFVRHRQGNWLISTPKFVPHLVDSFEKLGGVKYIFLTHRDDLGETKKYAERFTSEVIIHGRELECYPQANRIIEGDDDVEFSPDFRVIPTPGHTEGHCMLLFANKFLFSGDSLTFNRKTSRVEIWNPYWTWHSYTVQAQSIARLTSYVFEWILTSHGQRIKLEPEVMVAQISDAVKEAEMNQAPDPRDNTRLGNLEYYIGELRRYNQPLYARQMELKARAIRELLSES